MAHPFDLVFFELSPIIPRRGVLNRVPHDTAWIVKFDVLAVVPVGVPEISPVKGFKLKFSGSDPAVLIQVKVGVPPAACNVLAYGSFIVPDGRSVVRIVRTGGAGTTLKCRVF